MKIFQLTQSVKSWAGNDTLPRTAQLLWENDRGCVPVVDAEGRMTGILITNRDICLAWRAARGALSEGTVRLMSLRSDDDPGNLDLIAGGASVFFVREDGVVQQRLPEGGGDGHPPVSLGGPVLGPDDLGAFMRHAWRGEGYALRERGESFDDHYRQATIFWNSLSVRGREHLVLRARLELCKVESQETWLRVVAQLRRVDVELARRVAKGLRHPDVEGARVTDLLVPR